MKKILPFLILLFLASCSMENSSDLEDSKTYAPVEKEFILGDIDYSLISSSTKDIDGVEITIKNYLITNPTSNAKLDVTIYSPTIETKDSAVILIPGATGSKEHFLDNYFSYEIKYYTPEVFASYGYTTLIFSADGRGNSEGEEDYNGYIQQDGLYQLYRFLSEEEGFNSIGIVSYSYGVAMASGMIGRYQPKLDYYIEWEGPVDRYFVTVQCKNFNAVKPGINCNDDDYWSEREALRFVPYLNPKYFLIIQSEEDHVQKTYQHSVLINNLAVKHLDWVRVNGPENEINQEYTLKTIPTTNEKIKEIEILSYIKEFT